MAFLCFGSSPGAAQAAEGVSRCGDFREGVELDDGSVVAASDTCLAKFGPDGEPDPGFGDGGAVPLSVGDNRPDGQFLVELLKMPSGYLVATGDSFIRFTADGEPATTFGPEGRRRADGLVPFSTFTFDVFPGADDSFYFSSMQTVGGKSGQTVAKVKADGTLDETFNDDGIFYSSEDAPDASPFYFRKLALDDTGRILVAGDHFMGGDLKASVLRLTPAGDLDVTFGEAGLASSTAIAAFCPYMCEVALDAIEPAPDGAFELLGGVVFHGYRGPDATKTFWAEFDDEGALTDESSVYEGEPTPVAVHRLPGGDLVVREGTGGRIHPDGSNAFPADRQFDPSKLSPDGFTPGDTSYNPVTGNILSVGSLSGSDLTRGAIVKLDATTGEGVAAFALRGVAMAGPEICRSGSVRRVDGYGPWERCRITVRGVETRAGIAHANSVRPSFGAKVAVERPRLLPPFVKQQVVIQLPERLKLRRNGLRGHLSVNPQADQPGKFEIHRSGRRIVVDFVPKEIPWDPYAGDDLMNAKLTVSVSLARGGLKPIPARMRGRKLPLTTTVRISTGNPDDRIWWAINAESFRGDIWIPPRARR